LALGLGALLACLAFGGCGGASSEKSGPALTIRPEGTPEMTILAQIYGQALEIAGYDVKNAPPSEFGALEAMEDAKSGQIAGYPQHLSTSLSIDFGVPVGSLPTDPREAYALAKKKLKSKGLTALPPTPFGIANAVAMLRKTAQARDLETDSDLKGEAEQMSVKAPTYCHVSPECLGGIESGYGTAFEGVSYEYQTSSALAWAKPEPAYLYKVLENGEADASMVFTTDGRLADDKFVALADDKHVFPAGNVVWVTSPRVLEKAGPAYERAIVEAQKGLTLDIIRQLNAKVELEGKTPEEAAAEYLESIDYEAGGS